MLLHRPSRRPAGGRPGPRGATTRIDQVGRAASAGDECDQLGPGRVRPRRTGASVTWSSSGLLPSGSSRLGRGCHRVVSRVVAGLHRHGVRCLQYHHPAPPAGGRHHHQPGPRAVSVLHRKYESALGRSRPRPGSTPPSLRHRARGGQEPLPAIPPLFNKASRLTSARKYPAPASEWPEHRVAVSHALVPQRVL